MSVAERLLPKARQEDLVVEALPDETLVYDLNRDKAHCLNPTAALVWSHCDGETPVSEMAAVLETELGVPADDSVVWMALDRLDRENLLEGTVELPGEAARYSRREMMRTLGRVAGLTLLLPAVSSIVAPLAAQAGSCMPRANCNQLVPPNCTGLPLCENPNKCCVPVGATKCRKRVCP